MLKEYTYILHEFPTKSKDAPTLGMPPVNTRVFAVFS